MALAGGEKVIDVGCGLGQLARGMALRVGSRGAVIGVEQSADQLVVARKLAEGAGEQRLVEFRQGEAGCLPLHDAEWGTFDVAHARYLLEHVPDPVAVVREMVRAVRPGGRIILEDDAHDIHRLWPEPSGFGRLWSAYLRTYERVGNDACVGHRLVSLLLQAEAIPRRNTWLFFGACAGSPNYSGLTSTTSFGSCKAHGKPSSVSAILSRSSLKSAWRRSVNGGNGPMPPIGTPSRGLRACAGHRKGTHHAYRRYGTPSLAALPRRRR